jgi:hypothetical protein
MASQRYAGASPELTATGVASLHCVLDKGSSLITNRIDL